jgi:hemoglobin
MKISPDRDSAPADIGSGARAWRCGIGALIGSAMLCACAGVPPSVDRLSAPPTTASGFPTPMNGPDQRSTLTAEAEREPVQRSLFDRLGGQPVVGVVIRRTIERVAADPRTQRTYVGVRLPYLADSVSRFVCRATGGSGCDYEGETVLKSHADLRITGAEFDVMVQTLREELDRAGVDTAAKNDLLRVLGPMRREIVTAGPVR